MLTQPRTWDPIDHSPRTFALKKKNKKKISETRRPDAQGSGI